MLFIFSLPRCERTVRIIITRSLLLVVLAAAAGCASMGSPSSFLIDSVPVVKVGDTKIGPIDHIVFIPAKEEFPIEFSVKGSVFSREISSIVLTSFKQDVYLYKYWASLDGRHWVKSHKLMNVQPSGGFDHSGGKILVHIDISEDP